MWSDDNNKNDSDSRNLKQVERHFERFQASYARGHTSN